MTTKSYNNGDQGFLTSYFDLPGAPPRNFLDGRMYNVKVKHSDRRNCNQEMNAELTEEIGNTAKVLHFMDATKPWVYFHGRDLSDSSASNLLTTNDCFQYGLNKWRTNYLQVLDKFPGLDEHLRATVNPQVIKGVLRNADGAGNGVIENMMNIRGFGQRKKGMFDRDQRKLAKNAEGLKVSVNILNWKRPENVQKILEAVTKYEAVAEVVVWHCLNETVFAFEHPKVRHIIDPAANDQFGMNTRYKLCLESSQEAVLTMDDDVLPPEETVNSLLLARRDDPNRLHGTHGRNPHSGCTYNFQQTPEGPAQVVLTKILLTSRHFCSKYFEFTEVMEDFAKEGTPYWNGEDIYMSLVSQKVSGNLPIRHNLPYQRLQGQGSGISHNLKDHLAYRQKFLRKATSKLGLSC
eukprot:CAMPEP_0196594792 /NCGR_PEP_ID=MMETSP1081-20130531/79298_1 /TAXON_ID=36882 /ORGANISM="Pyramimonas amylifera, Strain CCMP720" /LENGTH=405 /DNA_ID=CAMNT_0041919147 /DNA_START=21 /DNA_END=1241 /DNA_ORIENTATION=+